VFDTISGLPVHVLVVHAVVVLLPLMALVTIAVAVRRRWRSGAPWVVAANAVVVALAYVAKESGAALQRRLQQFDAGVAKEHGEQGNLLWFFALGLLAAAVLVWLTSRSARLVPVAVVVAVLAGGAAGTWTYLTGESGARAVWGETVTNTNTP
jgi:glucan phosphoethanolaminetransferase (alkaline phosphatase superfamily)